MAVAFDAVGPSASGAGSATSPLQWNHTCGASATELLVGVSVDSSGDSSLTATATYNGVSMTSVKRWESGGAAQTAGFVQVFRMHSPPTGVALQVSVSVTGASFDIISGGSLSFTGSTAIGTPATSDSNGNAVTSGAISVPTVSASNMVAVFATDGSGGLTFTAGTSRFVQDNAGGGAAGTCGAATIPATGASVSVTWTQNDDFYGAIGVEVQAGGAAPAVPYGALRQAARARLLRARLAGDTSAELAPGTGNIPGPVSGSGRGGGMGASGALVRNPSRGPAFRQVPWPVQAQDPLAGQRQAGPGRRGRVYGISGGAPAQNPPPPPSAAPFFPARQAVRARLPQPPAGIGAMRGRCASSPPAPVRNPSPGPRFTQKPAPVRYVLPPWRPRAGRVTSNPGAPVANPRRGPPFYPFTSGVRAAFPQQPLRRGRAASSPGAPVANPGVVQVSGAPGGAVRAALPANPRGRVRVTPVPAPAGTPPAHSGPPFFPARQPAQARFPLPRRGRAAGVIAAAQVRNPSPGPLFRQALSPAAARLRILPPRGRVASNSGGPVQNPPLPPAPAIQRNQAVRAQQPQPGGANTFGRAATMVAIPVPANPAQGPAFRQATRPVRAQRPLPPHGTAASNPGGPVRNPPPPNLGPVFFPAVQAVRIRPSLPPRGRTAGGQGAPVRNPSHGPVFPAAHGPVLARLPLPPRGRTSGNPGIPVPPPLTPAPVYPLHGPVAARFPLPPRGRIAGNPGGPVANPVTRTGPPFFPLHWPARIRPALPPRGRIAGSPGAPVRNPRPGPAFTQAVRPIRAVIPQNAPRGRTGSNPGGPVANIPFGNPLFRTGQPHFQWDTEVPGFGWETASPGTAWATGVPVTS